MEFTLFKADCIGNQKNCSYPHRVVIRCADDMKAAAAYDHVTAAFKGNYRNGTNFISADVLVMDCDNDHSDEPADWISPESLGELFGDVDYVVVPSRHNMLPKDGHSARPRFHVYFPHKPIAGAERYKKLKERIHADYSFFDKNALDAARFIFGSKAEEIIWHEGWNTIDDLYTDTPSAASIPQGRRNSTMSHFAGRVIKRYGASDRAHEIFLEESGKCDPPLSDEELSKIWQSAVRFGKKIAGQKDYVPPDEYNNDFRGAPGYLKPEDYSDIGQARVLSREYREELRFSPATDFLRYNGIYWEESKEAAIAAAEEFLDLQLADAFDCINAVSSAMKKLGADPKLIKAGGKKAAAELNEEQVKLYEQYLEAIAYYAFVMKRRDMKYINSALQAAKPMLVIKVEELDADPYLLNTPSFTYDLRLGMDGQREHRAEDFITKVTAVDPGEHGAALWEGSLRKFFLGDSSLIDYVQETFGVSAVGKVAYEAMIIAYGEGRNGKSTCCNTAARVMGAYSGNMSADALTVGCKRNVKPEMAELKGKRLIIAAEMDEGMRLSTSVVKQLCSTDEVYAEKKYKAPFSFTPSHTVLLYTNHLPRVGAMDTGIWRRLIVIPFKAQFEGKNDTKNYAECLFDEAGPAVLAWIIEGAKRVIAKGFHLDAPECVREANEEYRGQNNWLGYFLDECCDVEEGREEKSGELYRKYREFCMTMGEYARSTSDFYTALEQAGFNRKRTREGRYVTGLALKVGDFLG